MVTIKKTTNVDKYWRWVVYRKMNKGLTPLRKQKISKKSQEKDDKIKWKYTLLIGIGIIGYSNYIKTSLSGLIQEVKLREKIYSTSSNIYIYIYIDQYDRMAHWVGNSLLK